MASLRSLLLLALTCLPAASLQPVLTSQYDSSRTGATLGARGEVDVYGLLPAP